MNPETEDLYRQIEAWAKGGPMPVMPNKGSAQMPAGPVSGGGGTQPAQALPAGPSGHPPSINDQPPAAAAPQPTAPSQGVDPRAAQYLQQHPETRAFFDQKYGAGAAARILGQ